MKRTLVVVGASLAVLLGSTGAAYAGDHHHPPMAGCGGGYIAPALSSHLHYRTARWDVGSDPDDGTLAIAAPKTWSFTRTPQGEGRFHDKSGNVLLSLADVHERGGTDALMGERVRSLAGTSGLRIMGQHTKVVGEERWSTLVYRWTSMGEPRTVRVRWIAYGTSASDQAEMVVTAAGRLMDAQGLDAMLAHVSPSAQLAG